MKMFIALVIFLFMVFGCRILFGWLAGQNAYFEQWIIYFDVAAGVLAAVIVVVIFLYLIKKIRELRRTAPKEKRAAEEPKIEALRDVASPEERKKKKTKKDWKSKKAERKKRRAMRRAERREEREKIKQIEAYEKRRIGK